MTGTVQKTRARRRQLLIALGAGQHPSRRITIALGLLIFFVSLTTKSLMAVDLAPSIYTNAQASGRSEFERDATSIVKGEGFLCLTIGSFRYEPAFSCTRLFNIP